jgi:hypothetical protein
MVFSRHFATPDYQPHVVPAASLAGGGLRNRSMVLIL